MNNGKSKYWLFYWSSKSNLGSLLISNFSNLLITSKLLITN